MSSTCVSALLGVMQGRLEGAVLARDDGDLIGSLRARGIHVHVLESSNADEVTTEAVEWVCLTPPKRANDITCTLSAALAIARRGVAMRMGLHCLEPNANHSPFLLHAHLSDVIVMSRKVVSNTWHMCKRYTTDMWLVWDKRHRAGEPVRLHFCT